MIVVTNRISVAEGYEHEFEQRFRERTHLVDHSPGFIRHEVHRPRPMRFDREQGRFVDDPKGQGDYEVKTWWASIEDFEAWTRSESFAEAHRTRPAKAMFDAPARLDIHEVIIEAVGEPGQ